MSVRRAVAGAALLFALNALGQVSETITVEVVEVPVYVTAADGTPIRGLAKDAFTLFVNGKPKPIDYFEEVDFHGGQALLPVPAAQGQARVPALHERRLYLLLFDLAFSRPGLIERAQRAADAAAVRSNQTTGRIRSASASPRSSGSDGRKSKDAPRACRSRSASAPATRRSTR